MGFLCFGAQRQNCSAQSALFRDAATAMIASLCINICTIDKASGYCEGCGRTIAEITKWASASEQRQRAILASLPERVRVLEKRTGPKLEA
ncbi:MAG: DUF1289 domain-containing protein [Pseudomonadota bacterium]